MTPRLRPFARKSSASLLFVTVFLFMTQAVSAQPDNAEDRRHVLIERMKKKIDQASSPVGDWIFTRLEVVTNAALAGGGAQASYELKSLLVRGTFTVSDDGSIKGNGTAAYSINVEAGANMPLPISIPIEGKARGSGERSFTVSGQADLENNTISLDALKPSDKPLKLNIIGPGAKTTVDWPPWPPMTNLVQIPLRVQGTSVLIFGSGTVNKFTVTFEAVKSFDQVNLFEMLIEAIILGPQGGTEVSGPKGDTGSQGNKGSSDEKDDNGEAGEKGKQEDSGAGSPKFEYRAGTVVVTTGQPT